MGFDEKLSWIATKKYKKIEKCVQFILNNNNKNQDAPKYH